MQKSTIGKLLLSSALILGGATAATIAIAQQNEAPAKVIAKMAPSAPYVDATYLLNRGMSLTMNVPRFYSNSMEITGTVTRMVLFRSCQETGEQDKYIGQWENLVPGTTEEYLDDTVEIGNTYDYTCYAYVGSDISDPMIVTRFAGIRPDRVTNLDVFCDDGQKPVMITFQTPSTSSGDIPLQVPLTYIRITRSEYMNVASRTEIARIENPEKNKVYTVKDDSEDLKDGVEYVYVVYVGCEYGESYSEWKRITLGTGIPYPPGNIKADVIDDTKVKVTWNPVTEAIGGAYMDPDDIMYDVYRVYSLFNDELVGSSISSTDFIDDITDLEEERRFAYRVVAFNNVNESDSEHALSNYVFAGVPAKIPYAEHFNDKYSSNLTFDNAWEIESKNSQSSMILVSWQLKQSFFFPDKDYNYLTVKGVNYDNEDEIDDGFVVAQFSKTNYGETILKSGRISMAAANPTLSFYYYAMPGSTSELSLLITPSTGTPEKINLSINETRDYGWEKETISLAKYAGLPWIKLQFIASCEKGDASATYIMLDEVEITDDVKCVRNLSYQTGENETDGLFCDLKWDTPEYATAPDAYEVYLDNELKATVKENSYRLQNLIDGQLYNASVVAVYGEEKTNPCKVTFKAQGASVEFVTSEETEVRYFNLQGVEISNPEKGQTLIRVSKNNEGKTTANKVVIR